MKKIILIHILLILGTACSSELPPESTPYSFFVAGHTYGKPGVDNIGLHPPFKAKFDYIKSRQEIKFGVLTGDIVPAPSPEDWDEVDADIDSLGLPVYFAVGNHDMKDRELYESRYGNTYFSFIYNNDLFVVLDPNIDHWNISGDQLTFLKSTVSSFSPSTDNIFVFFHQVLWRENDNIYKNIKLNSYEDRADSINFWSEVEPIFTQLTNQVFMFAGDVGAASWSSDFSYDKYKNISLISSGMGEEDGDNFVIINVHSDKTVSYDLICLEEGTLNCFGNLTDYRLTPTQ